MQYEVRKHCVT